MWRPRVRKKLISMSLIVRYRPKADINLYKWTCCGAEKTVMKEFIPIEDVEDSNYALVKIIKPNNRVI